MTTARTASGSSPQKSAKLLIVQGMSRGRARRPWIKVNGPSDSVNTLDRSIRDTSFLPFFDESILELTEK